MYERVFSDVYRAALRLSGGVHSDAEDAVQDAFVSLVRAARADASLEVGVGWLITAVRHRYLDRVRSRARESRRVQLVAVADERVDEPVGDGADLLSGLSERERVALVLRYVDGLSVREVAASLDSTVRATESLLQRAKRKAQASEDAR